MNTTPPHPQDKLPLRTKVSAGVGESVINVGINMPKEFGFVIYNLTMGVNAVLLSFALMIPRLWDAFTDPVMGSISDNTRSRWGRRKPYMFIGGLASAVLLIAICVPPASALDGFPSDDRRGLFGMTYSTAEWAAAGYFVVVSLLFYTALTMFSVPYGALTMELSPDYHERTRLMSFRTTFTYLSGIALGWALYATKWDLWVDWARQNGATDPIRSGELYGTWAVGAAMGLLLLVVAMVPTFCLKERAAGVVRASRAGAELKKSPLLRTLGETLRMPPFVLIVLAYTIAFFGIIMVIHLGQYISIFYTHDGDKKLGLLAQAWANTFKPAVGLATVFALNRLAGRVEKKIAWAGCLGISFIGAALTWFLYSPELKAWEPSILGVQFYLHPMIVPFCMLFPGLAATLMMSYSMIADVCDIDEINSGTRREGMYWAVFNWVQKVALSGALLMTGFTLSWSLFDQTAAQQRPETIQAMRLWFTLTLLVSIGFAMLLVLLIPLNRHRMALVRAELDHRHAATASHTPA